MQKAKQRVGHAQTTFIVTENLIKNSIFASRILLYIITVLFACLMVTSMQKNDLYKLKQVVTSL